ncbi:MAG: deoxycytidylate deaminase [Planctomycetota bacterium]
MSSENRPVPSKDDYYMGIAMAVRRRANCKGRRVGSLTVVGNRIVATGYNGTPEGMTNCLDGGCHRCNKPEDFKPGAGYDLCICVHAEQNCLLAAARFGISVAGGTVYTTLQPCFNCIKEMLQAKIAKVHYLHPWAPREELRAEYERLMGEFPEGVHRFEMDDPDWDWANNVKS